MIYLDCGSLSRFRPNSIFVCVCSRELYGRGAFRGDAVTSTDRDLCRAIRPCAIAPQRAGAAGRNPACPLHVKECVPIFPSERMVS